MRSPVRQLALLLHALGIPRADDLARAPVLVVGAHPGDEAIGASWLLRRTAAATVVSLTDGAPRDRALWPASAPRGRQGYAALRAIESRCALALVGVPAARIISLRAVDQEASLQLVELTRAVEVLLVRVRPAVVVTHAYEGGHPDHDAAAFVVHAAVARRIASSRPVVIEMTSGHRHDGAWRPGHFLEHYVAPQAERVLSWRERAAKAAMFRFYASQEALLAAFPLDRERYRRAPVYDFCVPPHEGPLHYDTLGWRIDGVQWRRLAARALDRLAPRAGAPVEPR